MKTEPNGASRRGLHTSNHWVRSDSGERYVRSRWSSAVRERRDPRKVGFLLDRYRRGRPLESILDAPCGSGRLRPALAARANVYVGVDVSASMLREIRDASVVRADLLQLPFASDTFEVVVACRILHHLRDERDVTAVLRELTRVARELVIVSFWDTRSLRHWRRRWSRRAVVSPRACRPQAAIRELMSGVGLRCGEFWHTAPFLSPQTFAVGRKLTRARRE